LPNSWRPTPKPERVSFFSVKVNLVMLLNTVYRFAIDAVVETIRHNHF
jgi:hypothetical protein